MKSLTQRTLSRRMLAVAAIASLSFGALAQEAARQAAPPQGLPIGKTLVLPCCNCLGQETRLDLSTGATIPGTSTPVPWTVNGASVKTVSKHPAWDPLSGAQWVNQAGGSGIDNAPGGIYKYQLTFQRPKCLIPDQSVTISGSFLADDEATITASGPGVSAGSFSTPTPPPGWGFKLYKRVTFNFTATGPGPVTLTVAVSNAGTSPSPTGLAVNAAVIRHCARENGPIVVDIPLDKKE